MIQREKAPNYVMGSVDPVSFGRGKRGINGVIRGLLLDLDLLYSKSFENEKALLDKDELFYLERINRFEKVQKEYIAPRLAKIPDPLPPRYTWIWQNYIKPSLFPGQSFGETAENCLEGAFEGALQGAAAAALGSIGGALALVGVAQGVILAIEGCLGAVIEGFVYEGGAFQLAMDLALCAPGLLYYEAYDDAVKARNELAEGTQVNNTKAKPTVREVRSMVEESIKQDFNYILPNEYNLENLSSNYVVNKVEYLDQVLPFDIVVIAVNEYGQSAQMRLYGCEIMSANSEFSIDSMTVPYSLNFTARTILPWRSFALGSENDKLGQEGNPAKQSPVPTRSSPAGTSTRVSEPVQLDEDELMSEEEAEEADLLVNKDPDGDADNDGTVNRDDAQPLNPAEQSDNDDDGVGDNQDKDDDNDGVDDSKDKNPTVPDDYNNIRGHQGVEENPDSDNDGVPDDVDYAPNDPTIQEPSAEEVEQIIVDTDGDGNPDMTDPDDDNDGLNDEEDSDRKVAAALSYLEEEVEFEDDPDANNEGEGQGGVEAPSGDDLTAGDNQGPYGGPDTDEDGYPDDQDDDIDGDGVVNEFDALPSDPNEHIDADRDGVGANSDHDDNDPNTF